MKSSTILTLVILAITLSACKKNQPKQINFYYWKSEVKLGTTERNYFASLGAQRLYLHLFDIDNEGAGIFPKAKIKPFDAKNFSTEYVPVVFITNRALVQISENEINTLALNTHRLIDEICEANHIGHTEIQIDCDWTPSTRGTYFRFLQQLKKVSEKNISCTIRLHQIEEMNKCGIPPVDRGVVMCYATSDPRETDYTNSILDLKLLKKYLQNINSYPLPTDMALPLYSWAVVRNHLGKIKLINGVTKNEMAQTDGVERMGNNRYRLKKDLVFHDMYLNQGFDIRLEEISPKLLDEAKTMLCKSINRDYNLIYYHLDSLFLTRYSINNLE